MQKDNKDRMSSQFTKELEQKLLSTYMYMAKEINTDPILNYNGSDGN